MVPDYNLDDLKVRTVLGDVSPESLGVVLPHEHLLIDASCWFVEPENPQEAALANSPVCPEILWWLRYHPFVYNRDDIVLLDEETAIAEAWRFKDLGGGTIVDMTTKGIGRNPEALARIAQATGLNIVMGSGYYADIAQHGALVRIDVEQLAEEIVRDIVEGVGPKRIRAGIIGEVGTTWPITPSEERSLRASARAQRETGIAINVHPGQHAAAPLAILDILLDEGADLNRVVISHLDRTVRDMKGLVEIAQLGCYLEYDLFGDEGYYPATLRVVDIPNDAQRLNELRELMDLGYGHRLLMSQDICTKRQLCLHGGWGYAHLLRETVPVMRAKGWTESEIRLLMCDNPRELLAFR